MMDAAKRQSVLVNIGERFDMLKSFEQRGRSTYRVSQYSMDHRRMSMAGGERKREQVRRSKSLPRIAQDLILTAMSEGRKTQVVLLDERQLEILTQPKLYAKELLDIVASHFNLKEKEYFGLSFKDDTGHHHWLQLDRRVLEHDFPKKSGPLVLYFAVRFFIESIGYLRDSATIELFYLQAKQAVIQGLIECDSETVFELAAHVLQETHGDYYDDLTSRKQLKKLPVLPTSCLKEHPSIVYCEDRVIEYYKKLTDLQRGTAIVNYMTIVESLPTYGVHYYEVKDKSGIPWWLGLSHKGISLYDYTDKKIPRRVFAWKQLENLYFRDKKFSIEVHDPKRIVHTLSTFNLYEDAIQEPIEEFDDLSDAISDPTTQVSVSRRTFGPGNVNVHAWFASTAQLTKCIWSMAVSQHQFYLDRQQSKSQLPQVRSMSEIANDLCQSTGSLPGSANSDTISRSNSAHSLTVSLSTNNSKVSLTAEELEASRAAQRDMFAALKARKDALEEALKKKTEELKALCIEEGKMTGILPKETPLAPGEPVPNIPKRMGTAFTLSPKFINRDKVTEDEEMLAKLELELELQDKIAKAAQKLAQDRSVGKSVRKQRKQSYNRAVQKLKDIEKKLQDCQRHSGKFPLKPQSSMEELSEDSREFLLDSDSEFISPNTTPALQRHDIRFYPKHDLRPSSGQVKIITSPQVEVVEVQQRPQIQPPQQRQGSPSLNRPSTPSSQGSGQRSSSPVSPVKHYPYVGPGASRGSTPSPGPHRHHVGYVPSSVYSTRTQYRSQMYPTFPHREQPNSAAPPGDYENGNGVPNRHMSAVEQENLYNVNTHRTAHYGSADELKSPEEGGEPYYDGDHPSRYPQGGGGGGDGRRYGSLDRNAHLVDYNQYDMVDELTPSKFGSKRESHSDYRDSIYPDGTEQGQYVDYMPPLPPSAGYNAETPQAQPGGNYPPVQGRVRRLQQEFQGYVDKTQGDERSEGRTERQHGGSNLPYIDSSSSHSSLHSGGSNVSHHHPQHHQHQHPSHQQQQQQWYESKDGSAMRQQAPPHTPQFESPPTQFVQEYPGSDSANAHVSSPQTESPHQPSSVAKQRGPGGYVEVSKPFEMSDFYKYSERLRKQRHSEGTMSPGPTTPTGVQSPYVARATHFSQGNVSNQGQQPPPQPVTPVYSQSRSRPTSPYSHSHPQEGSYSVHKMASSPSPSPYQTRTRTPYIHNAQGNYAPPPQQQQQQQGFYGQSGSYQGHPPAQMSPRHVTYQPPQPMTCDPIQQSHADAMPNKGQSNRRLLEFCDEEEEDVDAAENGDVESAAESLSEETTAWYESSGVTRSATLV